MPSKKASTKPVEKKEETEEEEELSLMTRGIICSLYMTASVTLTLINKVLYSKYKVSNPLNLFMI
jgi:hypothetical protein